MTITDQEKQELWEYSFIYQETDLYHSGALLDNSPRSCAYIFSY